MAIKDDKTPRLGLLLPFTDNFLQDDVERLRDTFGLLDVLVVTRDETTGKIADDMLSSVIAKLDAQGKLLTAQIPGSVVQKGPDGKIDASLMPSIAVVDTFPVPNEASMLGLQCERGDIAIREDLGKTFILTQMPPSVLSNWRELTSTNVTSVNGKTGAITGLAGSGANKDITSLEALSGPLRLGGDGAGDYDAVTMKQLRAASGGAGGASMNGVMNNFIGAVEWFNGSRAKLPAGYVAADGQTLNRVDWPDLWAAVAGSVLNSVTEAVWNTLSGAGNPRGQFYYNRGSYSQGDGNLTTGTTFRVPDLNGGQTGTGSIANTFLNGSAPSLSGNVGQLRESAAPNIKGGGAYYDFGGAANSGAVTTVISNPSALRNSDTGTTTYPWKGWSFDASKSDALYSGQAGELRPNCAVGIWIIRASGLFAAQSTVFTVTTADAAEGNTGLQFYGGELRTEHQTAGVTDVRGYIRADRIVGGKKYIRIGVLASNATSAEVGPYNSFDLNDDGSLSIRGNVTTLADIFARTCNASGMTVTSGSYPSIQWVNTDAANSGDIGSRLSIEVNAAQPYVVLRRAVGNDTGQVLINFPKTTKGQFATEATCDIRYKREINDYDGQQSLDNIDAMELKTYIFTDDEKNRVRRGVIAQQLETIDPEYVKDVYQQTDKGEDTTLKVLDSNTLLLDALAAIQVLSARVKELEKSKK